MAMENDIDRIVRTAKENICKGVIMEPRWYWDEITLPANTTTLGFSRGDAFKNGEAYPVQIQYMVAALRDATADERRIQQVGARLTFHGQDYMGRPLIALPLWHNQPVAAPNSITGGQTSHYFLKPWILSSRDTMRVRVQLTTAPSPSRPVAISFTGYGLQTKRPYFKSGDTTLLDTTAAPLVGTDFRNDGDEPIVMTSMDVFCGAETNANNPAGDVRFLRVQIRQVGNGTQADWFAPAPTLTTDLMPAILTGTCTGRAIVHQFPEDGLIWEPGEGLQVELQSLNAGANSLVVAVGLLGSIVVT